ncbi:hypothetical protein VHEMI10748 [[Torrubiella] hemipterigena]|uniref:Uncharacterized protein n=1 Tax=[Torrubiella] hemipterigena TaxID=1531966 RepID=A0A0A1TTP2_9HYPO|nr:hypothetical protein VHEMI10748 [[Torrubiella] hemipterigena]
MMAPSISQTHRAVRQLPRQYFLDWWNSIEKATYRRQTPNIKADLSKLPELEVPRKQLRFLLAARTNHGDFATYHERFHHHNTILECPCGREKTPTYIFYCRKIPPALRARLTPEPEKAIARYLSEQYEVFLRIAEVYFNRICRAY